MRFCTVVARNYLAYARVLASSLHEMPDDAQLSVLLLDDVDAVVDEALEPFEILRPADLDIEPREFHRMAAIYDILELSTAMKPWLLQRLLATEDLVCYLDPDIEVFASLAPVELLARRHSIVLTPHTTTPLPRDGLLPSEKTIRLAGVFNLGFIAVSREADSFLSWWADRLARECRIAFEEGLFVDQRWIDFVPSYFDHAIVSDPGYNVAYWNLFERELKLGVDGYEVNGRPLRFFHYSGFDPLRPYFLSKYQTGDLRIRLEEQFAVAHLCDRYASRLLAAGYLDESSIAYRYGYTAAGMPIDSRSRRVYAKALAAQDVWATKSNLPDPFDPLQAVEFVSWLESPGPEDSHTGLSRYVRGLYDERPDVATRFHDLSGSGTAELLAWVRDHGREKAGVMPEFSPPPARQARGEPKESPIGVNLVGYLRAENGSGAAARSLLEVLGRARSPVSLHSCTATSSRQRADVDTAVDSRVTYDTTIVCVGADQLPVLNEQMHGRMPVAASTVGLWPWEVEAFPAWMARSAVMVDEVWVYSRHVANAVSSVCAAAVHVFAPPVVVPDQIVEVDRADVGISDDFTFLFCFDFASGFERKNPLAVVNAFRRAFAPGEGPRLVVKSVNGSSLPLASARLKAAVEDRADIVVRDGYEPAVRQQALTAACDCYVSLHRAEGYGITLAEAMAAARPVIATAYSGNLEFMTAENAVLIPYELERIPFGCDPYPPAALWAEPDIDAASAAMQRMASDPSWATRLGGRARDHMAKYHTAESRVDFVRTRLHELRSSR
ncbi:MAG: glycosyltransferase family 4 protein [Acidimicrobiia bacterium]